MREPEMAQVATLIARAVRAADGSPLAGRDVVLQVLFYASPIFYPIELVIREASSRYDNGLPCGEQANLAKWLAADAAFAAADQAVQTHGGFGYAKEYDVERYWSESRLMKIAPISQEMILNYVSEHVLGLPRSY